MSGGKSQGTHQAVGEHLAHFANRVPFVGCGSARQVGKWIQTQNNGRVASAVWRILCMCRTMGIWTLERFGSLCLVWVLCLFWPLRQPRHKQSASDRPLRQPPSQTERLPLAATRRRAVELNNGAFSLVFSFWTTASKDEKTADICRGSLGREALRRVTTSTINMCPDRRKHQPFVAGEDIEDAPMHRKKMRRQKPSPVTCKTQSMQGTPMPGRCVAIQHFSCATRCSVRLTRMVGI
jgi:hypothetical protein